MKIKTFIRSVGLDLERNINKTHELTTCPLFIVRARNSKPNDLKLLLSLVLEIEKRLKIILIKYLLLK